MTFLPPQRTLFGKKQVIAPAAACAQRVLPGAVLHDVVEYGNGDGLPAAYCLSFRGKQHDEIHLLVSADPTNTPVICWREGEDPEFRNRELLLPKAQEHLPGARHDEVMYFGFGEFWHAYTDGARRVFLNARPGTPDLPCCVVKVR